MLPVLSTRVFGRLPDASELALARRLGFVDLAVWAGHLPADGPALTAFHRELLEEGLRVPAVHLPTKAHGARLDLRSGNRIARAEALDAWKRALDGARELGAHVAVAHASATSTDELWRAVEYASEQQLGLALEADTLSQSSLPALLQLLRSAPASGRGLGICVDLSRTRPTASELLELRGCLLWLELADVRGGKRHSAPEEGDESLRRYLIACEWLRYVTYEVVPEGPAGEPPGEAEIILTLRRLVAWHLNHRREMESPSQFAPL